MTVQQYIPAFVDGIKPAMEDVPDTAALLDIPWVKRWAAQVGFYRYSFYSTSSYLMAEFEEGYVWHVICIVTGENLPTGIPEWNSRYRVTLSKDDEKKKDAR